MPNLTDNIYLWLCKRAKGVDSGRVRSQGLIPRFRSLFIDDPIAIRKALLELRSKGCIQGTFDPKGEPISGFLTIIKPKVEVFPHVMEWQEVIGRSSLTEPDQKALMPIGVGLKGFSEDEMAILVNGLILLREDQQKLAGQFTFAVSASYLLGSSKLLDSLDQKSLKAFGISLENFLSRQPYIVVGGNSLTPSVVILVENPISFEMALMSKAVEHCLFVCTFGFGLSLISNEYGNQLAGAVESGNACLLNRSHGKLVSFNEILDSPVIYFWGDLDIAGMHIFLRLAAKIPQIKLSALYEPMIEFIKNKKSCHPYVLSVGKEGQLKMKLSTPKEDVQRILKCCANYAVDQEVVTIDEISQYADKPFYGHNFV